MAQRLLITGASGFLGGMICKNAFLYPGEKYAILHQNSLDIPKIKVVQCDISNPERLREIFENISPSVVIHAAALAQTGICEQNQDLSYALNVKASMYIANLCQEFSAKLLFTSTDHVFAGDKAPYCETDLTNPVNIYGKHKVEAENYIRKNCSQAIICRLPLMYGVAFPPKGLLYSMLESMKQGKILRLFSDEFRTPASNECIAKEIFCLIEKNFIGTIHLGGHKRISRYELGCKIAEIFGYPKKLLISCLQKDVNLSCPRPKDVSLDNSKAFSKGYSPLSLQNALEKIKNQWNEKIGKEGML